MPRRVRDERRQDDRADRARPPRSGTAAEARARAAASTSSWPISTPDVERQQRRHAGGSRRTAASRAARTRTRTRARARRRTRCIQRRCTLVDRRRCSRAPCRGSTPRSASRRAAGTTGASGREAEGRGDQRDRVRDRERGHDQHERAEAAERESRGRTGRAGGPCRRGCGRTRADEPPRGLVPARVEPDESRDRRVSSNARSAPAGGW